VVAVVILSACSLQEVSGTQLRSGADLTEPVFTPSKTGQSEEEYKAYAQREKEFGLDRENKQVSQNAVYQAKNLRATENAMIKEQLVESKKVQSKLVKNKKEVEAFQNLDEDEKEEREIEKKEDEKSAKIKDESAKKEVNIKEDVEFNRFNKEEDTKEAKVEKKEDKKEGKVKSKTEVKVVQVGVVKSEQKVFHSNPDVHDEPEQEQNFDTMLRGDDKELTDMFFEDGKDDKAEEDSTEAYVPGFQ